MCIVFVRHCARASTDERCSMRVSDCVHSNIAGCVRTHVPVFPLRGSFSHQRHRARIPACIPWHADVVQASRNLQTWESISPAHKHKHRHIRRCVFHTHTHRERERDVYSVNNLEQHSIYSKTFLPLVTIVSQTGDHIIITYIIRSHRQALVRMLVNPHTASSRVHLYPAGGGVVVRG